MKADRKIIKNWVRQQNRASRSLTLSIALMGMAHNVVGMVQAWALAHLLAQLLLQHLHHSVRMVGVFVVCSIVRIGIGYLQDITAIEAGQHARRRLRQQVMDHLFAIGPAMLRHHHSARLAALLVDRIEAVDGYFARWLPASVVWVVAQWSVVAVVVWQNRSAGMILALCCVILPFLQAVFGIATARASRRQFSAMSRLQTRFLDRMRGIATIVLSGNAEKDAQALAHAAEEFRHRTMKVLRVAFMTSATTDIVMIVALVWIVISQSHTLTQAHSVEHAAAALFAVFMVPEAFAAFRALSAAYQDKSHITETAEAMAGLPPVPTGEAAPSASSASPQTQPEGIALRCEDVFYQWAPEREPAVQGVSFQLEPGQSLLLEGASGAGKSTLIELLLGFVHPQKGDIYIGGVPMRTLSPEKSARLISWVGQRPVLFAGTLRDNILFAAPEASEEALQHAVEASRVSTYLEALPEGLETVIGEGGFGLSGGQAQRVAVARAFLKNSPLLVMDEPTAHLDPETEADILEALSQLLRGRTAVIATHSAQFAALKTTHHLTLDAGRLVSQGRTA